MASTTSTTQTAASVDLGTNSAKITVAQIGENKRVRVLHDETRITRLGKSVDASGRLDPAAVEKNLAVIREFGEIARNLGAIKIAAVGTSALRDAKNGAEFVARAEALLGGSVEIISGDREAELTFLAARRDPDLNLSALPAGTTIVTTDSGGGSTEVVQGSAGGDISYKKSLQVGAVRVTERAAFSDPPTNEELTNARQMVRDSFAGIPLPNPAPTLVASGGTIANLAAMQALMESAQTLTADVLHGTRLSLGQIESLIVRLAALPLFERRNVPGLEPERADVIIAGAIIQAESLRHFNTNAVLVSLRGLRYGLLYELLGLG